MQAIDTQRSKTRKPKARDIMPLVRSLIAEELIVVQSTRLLSRKYELPRETIIDIVLVYLMRAIIRHPAFAGFRDLGRDMKRAA